MVVGNGLIAKKFSHYKQNVEVVIFASGVSNSTETRMEAFERERLMVLKTIASFPDSLFVYFSTYSLTDPALKDRAYGKHKLAMENLIKEKSRQFLILRLTNIVGSGGNPNTIFNFLLNGIVSKQKLTLWKHASRNLLDVDDLVEIASRIINRRLHINKTITIANPKNYTIEEIVQVMAIYFKVKPHFHWLDKGSKVEVDIEETKEIMEELHKDYSISYLSNLLEKYYGEQQTNHTLHV